ncbi:MAG: hypothetical protein RLZZ200_3162 [Pseudomonadota bacterium]
MNIKTNIRAGKQSGTTVSTDSSSSTSTSSGGSNSNKVVVPVYTRCGV